MSDTAQNIDHDERWRNLGDRLRSARKDRGMSLRELARRLAVSPGHVSQLERGLVAPSISLLYSIVAELELSLDSLFAVGPTGEADTPINAAPLDVPRTAGESRFIQRASERKGIDIESGVRWELLTPTTEDDVDFREIVYSVGGGSTSGDRFIRHPGKEYGIVLVGRLNVQIGFDEFVLGPGDSIALDSTLPHRFWNDGPVTVRAIWFSRAES